MLFLDPPGPVGRIAFVMPGPARLPYHISTIEALLKRGAEVVVVMRKYSPLIRQAEKKGSGIDWERYLDELYDSNENLEIVVDSTKHAVISSYERPSYNIRRQIDLLRGYSSYLKRYGKENYYAKRWFDYLPERSKGWASNAVCRRILSLGISRRLLSWSSRLLPTDAALRLWLRTASISAVVVSPGNTRDASEAEFIYAAGSVGVPSAVAVQSWDNLTTKGLMPKAADCYLAWNEFHRQALTGIHDISPDKITVTGSPFLDKWFDGYQIPVASGDPQAANGLSSERFILYLGSSANIAGDEAWLIRDLASLLSGDDFAAKKVVVRCHPANDKAGASLMDVENVTVVETRLPYSAGAIQELGDLIASCDCVVGINTTAMIDAVILGKQCFTIRTKQYSDTHFGAEHFTPLIESGALYIAEDVEDFLAQYRRVVMHGEDLAKEARQRFVTDFVRPKGNRQSAGEMAAQVILDLV